MDLCMLLVMESTVTLRFYLVNIGFRLHLRSV